MIKKIVRKFRSFFRAPPASALITGKGYNIVINGYVWRYEPTWKRAYKAMRKAQRSACGGIHIEMRRIAPGKPNYGRGSV